MTNTKMDPKSNLISKILIKRQIAIVKSRASFWNFCKSIHNYREDWTHLKTLCDTLQLFYERKLVNKKTDKPYRKLMINIPPRHYKTRTLVLFSAWTLGRNSKERIISTSYSDDLATEFSRYTRDEISREKTFDFEIVYSDIFPNSKLKYGDSSYHKWALEGEHFNYKGAGIGSAITGQGCTIGIIDDQIKNFDEAVNETALDKKWTWYTGTYKSRLEENSIEIICMTRWSNKDICGRILDSETERDDWYILSFEAYDKETDKMLCPEFLSRESYEEKRKIIEPSVFLANYHNVTIEEKGRLYTDFKTYDVAPEDRAERRLAYIDTADEGNDNLCAICGVEVAGSFYILDVIYTKEPQEITEDLVANMIVNNKIKDVKIESNNGGRAFSRNVERIVKERYKKTDIIFESFFQSKNKLSRILTNASNVNKRIIFPIGYQYKWPIFYKDIATFMRSKQNKNDDAPDTLTGIIETIEVNNRPVFTKGIM